MDQEKPTEKELDTVRVVQAIQKSKEKKEEREKEKTVCLFMDSHGRKKYDRLLHYGYSDTLCKIKILIEYTGSVLLKNE